MRNDYLDYLIHYGTKRHSGRYPWGSGEDPYQGESASFRARAKKNGTYSDGAYSNSSNSKDKGMKSRTSSENNADSQKEKKSWFTANIKDGKDKPNISPAEKIAKNASRATENASDIVRAAQGIKNRKKPAPDYSSMSDQEIRQKINRLSMERQLSQLTSEDTNTGFETVKDILSIVGGITGIAATGLSTYAIVKGMK